MHKRLLLLTISLLVLASTAYGITAEEIVAEVQKVYDGAEDYKAEFFQESLISSIKRVRKAQGIAYFKKHGRMYWEYTAPVEQKFISNGKTVWMYQPDMNQVQVFDFASLNLSNTENSFLDGIGNLSRDFDVKYEGVDVEAGGLVLVLTPKDASVAFKSMRMVVNKDTYSILKTTTDDVYGNKNTITFKGVEFNTGISDDFFDFKVPEGVHVVTPPSVE